MGQGVETRREPEDREKQERLRRVLGACAPIPSLS